MVGIVVRPHNIEFDQIVVFSLKISVIKTALEEGASVVPILIIDKDVYSVLVCTVYLHLHHVGIGFVNVAP